MWKSDSFILFYSCGLFNFLIALMHLSFWRTVASPAQLKNCSKTQSGFIHIANIQLIIIFILFSCAYTLYPQEMLTNHLGKVINIGLLFFWIARTIEQFVFAKWHFPRSLILLIAIALHFAIATQVPITL